jgi:hypothetical protein
VTGLTWEAAINKASFLIIHVTLFELPMVLLATALASWRLCIVLEKHNARQKEANLARVIAFFYLVLLVVISAAAHILK